MSSRIYDFQIKHVKYHGKNVMLILTCTRIGNISNSCTRQKMGVFRHVQVQDVLDGEPVARGAGIHVVARNVVMVRNMRVNCAVGHCCDNLCVFMEHSF